MRLSILIINHRLAYLGISGSVTLNCSDFSFPNHHLFILWNVRYDNGDIDHDKILASTKSKNESAIQFPKFIYVPYLQ